MAFPLCVTCCFSLTAFNILSLFLISVDWYVSRHVSPWVYPVLDSLYFLNLTEYFFSHAGKVFNYNIFKNVLSDFLFLFFFWDPYNSNVGELNTVPEVSKALLNYFHSFSFILISNYFHHLIFQLTVPFFFFLQLTYYCFLLENF